MKDFFKVFKEIHQIKQNPLVPHQGLQEDLLSSEICVTKQTISNEIHRNNLKSHFSQKTLLVLKKQREARLKFVCEHEDKEKSY